MIDGYFYFLDNSYFRTFRDDSLMGNKTDDTENKHGRPCFYAFRDSSTALYWLIPISSQVEKFKQIYDNKIKNGGVCDTIAFATVLGHERAFLIQNMCPASSQYIAENYKHDNVPVAIDNRAKKEIIHKAKRVLALNRRGIKLIFPDVEKIERELLQDKNNLSTD